MQKRVSDVRGVVDANPDANDEIGARDGVDC